MRRHVVVVVEGEWLPWHKRERWICCDCSLAHDVEYRKRNNQMELRMYRDNRSTAAYRRHQGMKLTKKDK